LNAGVETEVIMVSILLILPMICLLKFWMV
jgi:hypothetical protein